MLTQIPLVVGIGASAGGLEALQEFLLNVPRDHDYALVIIQHLDPDHNSLLPELLSKITPSPVKTAQNGEEVKAGHIYLIAPGESLWVQDGRFVTENFSKPRGRRRPIDQFFESLADGFGGNAVAIILSGTGSDGSVGIRAIKEHGGLVFVQDPEQSKYDGMPRSAIETGAHDLVLPVGEMAEVLQDYFRNMDGLAPEVLSDAEFIRRAMKHVRYRTGHDFQNYKPGTLLRRIAIRMSVLGIAQPNAYLKELIESPTEVSRLFRDILINVTSFFRDTEVWDHIKEHVIPTIVEGRGRDDEVRIWVAGCSTGQEAYTIGILVAEELARLDVRPRVAIFATDIDDDALRFARFGLYPNSIVDEVPEEYLRKYFNWLPNGYEIQTKVRDMVRFSNQSIIKDPPFSRLDMVSCRNVLIYFDSELQDTAMRVFQYGLRENGYLLLGSSESPSMVEELFVEHSKKRRLYSRRPGPAERLQLRGMGGRNSEPPLQIGSDMPTASERPYADVLIEDFAPPYLLLSHMNDVQFSSERAAHYLQFKPGRPQLDISQMIRPELETILRRLLNKNVQRGGMATLEFQDMIDGKQTRIEISRKVLLSGQQLIVFRDFLQPLHEPDGSRHMVGADAENAYLRELEIELDDARRTIRTTIEELETSNEELKSSNEEMMSMNEELQSANEELTTTNEELNNKITEVREANGDLANFVSSAQIATVFLTEDMTLRSFTPEAQTVFRFVPEDRGRRIDDIGTEIDIDQLMEDCREVSRNGKVVETEYQTRNDDRTLQARILPYRAEGELTGGVVFTLVDVTNMRRLSRESDRQSELSRQRLNEIEEIYRASTTGMALLRPDLTFERVNQKFSEINSVPIEEVWHKRIDEVFPRVSVQLDEPARKVLRTGESIEGVHVHSVSASDPNVIRSYEIDYYPVMDGEQISGIGLNMRDVTEQERLKGLSMEAMVEMQRRLSFILDDVQTMVNNAALHSPEEQPVLSELSERINAMAGTYDLLTNSNWKKVKMNEVLQSKLAKTGCTGRITMKGRDVEVSPRGALSIGACFYELAILSKKQGALSTPDGSVTFSWVRQDDGDDDSFIFIWRETGVPQSEITPISEISHKLISSTISDSMNGSVTCEMAGAATRCEIRIPADHLTGSPAAA